MMENTSRDVTQIDGKVLVELKKASGCVPLVLIGMLENQFGVGVVMLSNFPGVDLAEMSVELSNVMEKYMIQSGAHIQAQCRKN